MVTAAEKARKAIIRKRRKLVLEETRLARLKKKMRSADSHDKYLLGNMTVIAGWENNSFSEIEIKLGKIPALLADEYKTKDFKLIGETLFQARAKKSSPSPNLSEEERKAQAHQRITIGGEIIKRGLGLENRAVLLGAMKSLE